MEAMRIKDAEGGVMGWPREGRFLLERATRAEPVLRVVDAEDEPRPATAGGVLTALESSGWRRVHRLRAMGARWTVTRTFDGGDVAISCSRGRDDLTLMVSSAAQERWLREWLRDGGFGGCAIVVESPEDRFPWMSWAIAASAIALFVWIVAIH
jgi:hypothetical protein